MAALTFLPVQVVTLCGYYSIQVVAEVLKRDREIAIMSVYLSKT